MTRDKAIKEAIKRWGTNGCIRAGKSLSSHEKRQAATELVLEARNSVREIDQMIEDRLKALDWYQQLLHDRREARQLLDRLQGELSYHKFTVGEVRMGMFWIEGSGDTWEQAFVAADAKKGDKR